MVFGRHRTAAGAAGGHRVAAGLSRATSGASATLRASRIVARARRSSALLATLLAGGTGCGSCADLAGRLVAALTGL